MRQHIWMFLITLVLAVSGCAKLQHLPQLLTLKGVADEGDRQHKYVRAQDQKFDQLRADFKNNQLENGLSKSDAIKKYGDPINDRVLIHKDQEASQLLFRYAVKPFDSDKIYLYFDKDGRLFDSEFIEHIPKTKPAP